MDERKKSEVMAVFWFITSTLTLLSLWSYTPYDIPFEVSTPNSPVKNFVGVSGAYFAWFLIILFGKTSYFLVPIFLVWALSRWTGRKSQKLWLKVFSTVIFLTSSCALFAYVGEVTEIHRFRSGGLIGYFVSNFLSSLFGSAGMFVALSLFILSIILTTELLLVQMTTALFRKFKTALTLSMPESAERPAGKKPLNPIAAKLESLKPKAKTLQPIAVNPKTTAPLKSILTKPEAAPESKKAEAKPALPPKEALPQKPQIKLSIPKPVEPPKPPKPESEELPHLSEAESGEYRMPPVDYLQAPPAMDQNKMQESLEASSKILEDTLRDFGIEAKVVEVEQGPTITRYELQPAAGVKVGRITSLENDISLAMRATSVRIIAPIPGKNRVGIEVPNMTAATVYMREIVMSSEFQNEKSKISIAIGKDTAGAPLVCNLADMPHLLIAGATNTGKSVCINSIITSILFKAKPDEVKFLMIDPKMVELHFYNDLPHLIAPVVTEKAKAPGALAWAVTEMERRYRLLSKVGAKNIATFNEKVERKEINTENLYHTDDNRDEPIVVNKMPYIVIIIDELADLMIASAQEVEGAITRLAQLARAVGIHMILATQRPSVDVITGVIKANFPARIAFQVASKVDSRTILDENGADKLLGRGDFLLMDPRKSKLIRGQGSWVQDKEIEKVTTFIKNQKKATYIDGLIKAPEKKLVQGDFKNDEMYSEAKRIVLDSGTASVSMIQRRLGLGYARAARMIDMMEEEGIVGPYRGSKPREILVARPNASPESASSGVEAQAGQDQS